MNMLEDQDQRQDSVVFVVAPASLTVSTGGGRRGIVRLDTIVDSRDPRDEAVHALLCATERPAI